MTSVFHADTLQIKADRKNIEQAQNFIIHFLTKQKTAKKELLSASLMSEEVLDFLIENRHSEQDSITIKIVNLFGNTKITIDAKGTPLLKGQLFQLTANGCLDEEDERYFEIILEKIRNATEKNISVIHKSGRNIVEIQVRKSSYNKLYNTLIAAFGGVLFGIGIRSLLPVEIGSFVASDILSSVSGVFLNALKMISIPFIFFSIMNGITGFKDIKALGKTSARVIIGFMFTTIAAMFLAYGLSVVFPVGDTALRGLISSAAKTTAPIKTVSIVETLKGIVPTDIVSPFANANTLQVVFLSVLLGISILLIGDKYPQLFGLTQSMNAWFLKACSLITSLTPFISFCSLTQLCIQIDLKNITAILAWLRQIYVADLLQLLLYFVFIAVFGRTNPIRFFKNSLVTITTAFSTSSTNAALPVSLQTSKEKLNISPKIYAFSLPFGAAIHRDGTVITQMVSILFFAHIFDIPITGSILMSLMITVFSLSMGEGALAGVSVLLLQLNLPTNALNLIIGLYGIAAMIQTVNNVAGDMAVTVVVDQIESRKFRKSTDNMRTAP